MVSFLQARIELMLDIDYLHINGRYLFKDNLLYLYNGGSSASFKMYGTAFTIDLVHIPSPGYFYIVIDRDYSKKHKIYNEDGFQSYLFKEKSIHYIDIIKANEANDDTLLISDIATNGELLKYDHEYDKKVRVFGDSTVAGFGILKHDGYAHLLAQKFSSFYAECNILNEEDEKVRASRLKIAELTKDMLTQSLYLLGIVCPPKMLRKE